MSIEKNRVIWINIEQVTTIQSCFTTPVIYQYIGWKIIILAHISHNFFNFTDIDLIFLLNFSLFKNLEHVFFKYAQFAKFRLQIAKA